MYQKKREPGCTNCAGRHVKCDRAIPACSNCAKQTAHLKCVYPPLRLRPSVYTAKVREVQLNSRADDERSGETTDGQEFLASSGTSTSHYKPPSRLQISSLCQTTTVRDNSTKYGQEILPEASSQQQQHPTRTHSPSEEPQRQSRDSAHQLSPQSVDTPDASLRCSIDQDSTPFSPWSNSVGINDHACSVSSELSSSQSLVLLGNTKSHSPPSVSTIPEALPLATTDPLEMEIFSFYTRQAGPWLDIVSPGRCFGQHVPRLAMTRPVLYYACLSYASHVMALNGKLDAEVEARLNSTAISLLIPMLSHFTDSMEDGVLLATIVILRMSEQFYELGDDAQYHLGGAATLLSASHLRWSPSQLDVCGTSFWVWVRESIRICFLNEQSSNFDTGVIDDVSPCGSAADEVWTNRMSYLLLKLCNICWAEQESPARLSLLESMQEAIEQWRSHLPETFKPWGSASSQYDSFANIQFLSSWHVIAWQQYYSAKVMIAVYTARLTTMGILDATRYLEAEITGPARMLCAICFSCDDIGSEINGAHLLAWCGQYFTGREEQRRVVAYLKHFMEKVKWPNKTCYQRLEQIWKCQRTSWKLP